ncbi:hypothetical protein, partial [Psittacicella hinzii]|uniref:hypothetical protein n=1 Tax=Psittacicella hinzii TaxID=2028575 RepID=UPI003621387A
YSDRGRKNKLDLLYRDHPEVAKSVVKLINKLIKEKQPSERIAREILPLYQEHNISNKYIPCSRTIDNWSANGLIESRITNEPFRKNKGKIKYYYRKK